MKWIWRDCKSRNLQRMPKFRNLKLRNWEGKQFDIDAAAEKCSVVVPVLALEDDDTALIWSAALINSIVAKFIVTLASGTIHKKHVI